MMISKGPSSWSLNPGWPVEYDTWELRGSIRGLQIPIINVMVILGLIVLFPEWNDYIAYNLKDLKKKQELGAQHIKTGFRMNKAGLSFCNDLLKPLTLNLIKICGLYLKNRSKPGNQPI